MNCKKYQHVFIINSLKLNISTSYDKVQNVRFSDIHLKLRNNSTLTGKIPFETYFAFSIQIQP